LNIQVGIFILIKEKIVDYENRRAYQIDSIKMLKSYGFIEVKSNRPPAMREVDYWRAPHPGRWP